MSNTIDNRVVEMKFDNAQFERGVSTSVDSLGELKKSLNFESGAKSLSNLSLASRNFSLENVSAAVTNVANNFTALGAVGFTVLQNLTNMAMNLAMTMAQTILILPLRQGFQEYETQMGAIQTIMANTAKEGTTLKQVNGALNELNMYADKTIYNFTEMTRNIGTFTAAGVKLDTSVAAIKGIANLAAVSGSTSQQASVAMYQLSQAMASGTVRLMDWNSVVNAGMGGQVFQESLKETARVHGIAIDEMLKTEGSFRETLAKGWLTTEILTETLSKFTGDLNADQLKSLGYTEEQIKSILELGRMANDAATKVKTFSQLVGTLAEAMQSGWAQSWQIIVGDFEEAKALMTEISNILGGMIGASADSRNAILSGWKELGGRTALIDAVRNAFEGVLSIVDPIKRAFAEIFPPVTAQQLYDLSAGVKELSVRLKIGGETADKIKRTFKGVAALFDIVRMATVSLASGFYELLKNLLPSSSKVLDFSGNIGDALVSLRDWIKTNDIFNRGIQSVGIFLGKAREQVEGFLVGAKKVYSWIEEAYHLISSKLADVFGNVDTSGVTDFVDRVRARFSPLTKLSNFVSNVFSAIGRAVESVAPVFMQLGALAEKGLVGLAKALVKGITNINYDKAFDVLNGGLISALILAVKNFVNDGSSVLGSISSVLGSVETSLKSWQENLKAKTLLSIAYALGIMAASIVALTLVDSTKLTGALAAIGVMFGELMGTMAIVDRIPSKNAAGVGALAGTMVVLAGAVLILSFAVTNLARLNTKELFKGMVAIQALGAMLIVFSYSLSRNAEGMAKASIGLIAFAVSLNMIAGVVERLGKMDVKSLAKGIISIAAITTQMKLFLATTKSGGMGLSQATGLILLAGAVMILSVAVERFASMDSNKMLQGLGGVALILAQLGIFVNLTGDSKRVISTAVGLTILGAAILIFSEAIGKMGSMSWEQLGKGLLTMAAALSITTAALRMMPKNILVTSVGLLAISAALSILAQALTTMGGMSWGEVATGLAALAGSMLILSIGMEAMSRGLPGAAAMLVMSAALAIFAPALKNLGSMNIGEIGLALLAIAGIFLILGIAGLVLAPLIPTLLSLSGTLLLFGLACASVGLGVLLFSAGLSALAVSGAAAAAALVLIVTSIVSLIPMIVVALGAFITAIAEAITVSAPAILGAFVAILLGLVKAIATVGPPLIAALVVILLALIAAMVELVPAFVDGALFILSSMLKSLASHAPEIIQAGFDILIALLEGVRNNIRKVVETAIQIIIEFIEGIASQIPAVIQAGVDLILAFVNGLADAIRNNNAALFDAGRNLADAIVDGILSGLTAGVATVGNAMANLGNSAIAALKKALGIKSPSKKAWDIAKFTVSGFVNGLLFNSRSALSAAERLGENVVIALSSVAEQVDAIMSGSWNIDPTIRPVVDLTDVLSGGKKLDSIFGKELFSTARANSLITITSSSPGKLVPELVGQESRAGGSVNFTQNNYSPKALSQLEIYRQTKKQLAQLKGLVQGI